MNTLNLTAEKKKKTKNQNQPSHPLQYLKKKKRVFC